MPGLRRQLLFAILVGLVPGTLTAQQPQYAPSPDAVLVPTSVGTAFPPYSPPAFVSGSQPLPTQRPDSVLLPAANTVVIPPLFPHSRESIPSRPPDAVLPPDEDTVVIPPLFPPPVPRPDRELVPAVALFPSRSPTPTPVAVLPGLPGTAPEVAQDPILSPVPKRFEMLPGSLLWEPMLAVKRDPRSGFVFSNVDSRFSRNTADPSIGTTFGIGRFNADGSPVVWQTDIFAVVHSRYSDTDFFLAADYRAGVLATASVGDWRWKFGYEHTSTHIGDETLDNGKGKTIPYERDELVAALGYLYDNRVRVYGQAAYSLYRNIENRDVDRWRYDVGFDWYRRAATTRVGQPFAALNVGFDGATGYDPTFVLQLGWMWKADRRLGQFRVYAEYFDGKSAFGQLYNERERYLGFGLALDY